MTWAEQPSVRNEYRPPGHRGLRIAILVRDGYRCHVCGQEGADEMDHVVPLSTLTDEQIRVFGWSPENLAAIHSSPCHREKTAREAAAGRARAAALRPRATRPAERHPGILPEDTVNVGDQAMPARNRERYSRRWD